ncbi:MAG: hypothetical protein EXQ76_02045 [Candidatus Planktophila sp.]|nr:hypothetical protein [Candidatus Planktophila sp.]
MGLFSKFIAKLKGENSFARNGGMPAGMAGMGMPAMPVKGPTSAPKKKSKSGNPAKRALKESQ